MNNQRNIAASLLLTLLVASSARGGPEEAREETDYLSFAQGAYPVLLEGASAELRVGLDQALQLIDGNPRGFSLTPKPADSSAIIDITYQLPAPTTFTTFAIPNVLETPSPAQTFIRNVSISGSSAGPDGPFTSLGSIELRTHSAVGETTVITVPEPVPARWIKVRLAGGIDEQRERMFLEFSELVGHGSQESAPLQEGFGGAWKGRGIQMALEQRGAVVQGCYDADGELEGTVAGTVLRATGTSQASGVPSTFVLTLTEGGELTGVRSTNGAPFRLLQADNFTGSVACSQPQPKPLGCGSVIHGITFGFDSAVIRTEAEPLLDDLHAGLKDAAATRIVVQGHTSSEGTDAYNLQLSQRRAEAVLEALTQRGLPAAHLSAVGIGEARPIADNLTEAGRSLNRRVEIACQ